MGSQTTDKARESMQEARDKAGEAGEAALHRAREVGEAAYNRARETGEAAIHRAREAYDQAGDYVRPYRRSFEDVVSSNPVKAVAMSLAVGVVLGCLIKRS